MVRKMKSLTNIIATFLFVFLLANVSIAENTNSAGKITKLLVQECCGTLAPYVVFNVENRSLSQNDCTSSANWYAIPLNTEVGKAQYSFVLAAYMSGKAIKVTGSGECLLTREIFEDVKAVGDY